MKTTREHTTARIFWDRQDPNNNGWAWATRVDGEHDDTGPLGDGHPEGDSRLADLYDTTDKELREQFRREVCALDDANIEIVW